MKIKLLTLILAMGLLQANLPEAFAQNDSETSTKKSVKKAKKLKKGKKAKKSKKAEAEEQQDEEESVAAPKAESAVAKLLKSNTYFNKTTPNYDADYFILLKSASWCGPCCREMPEIAKAYKLMEASGAVELILLGHDKTQPQAEKWMKDNKADFPAVMNAGGISLPKMPPSPGIPFAAIMKSDGTIIESGHGSIIRKWRSLTIGEYSLIGDTDEKLVGKAISKMKFTNGKPSRKADYYIYIYSPSLSDEDADALAELSKEYSKMKSDKVEVILITGAEDNNSALLRSLKKARIKFPSIVKSADGVAGLPAIGTLGKEPHVWMVSQGGGASIDGDLSAAGNWQKVVEANASGE